MLIHAVKYLTERRLEGRDPGMTEVTGTSRNWNARFQALTKRFQALIKRFQAVGGGGFFVCVTLRTTKIRL